MKIKRELPQFSDKKVLFLVTGTKTAAFWQADSGQIEKTDEIEISNRTYSDREGFFMRRGQGRTLGSGSVYESKDKTLTKRFIDSVVEKLKDIVKKNGIDLIYIFAPKRITREMHNLMPGQVKELVYTTIEGNYTQEHPFSFLKIIKALEEEKDQEIVTEAEVAKILARPNGSRPNG